MNIVNSKRELLKTKNGGRNWDIVNIDEKGSVEDFQFINDFEGFAIASEGLYKTNDAGATWKLIKERTEEKFYSKILFIDGQNGFLIGSNICFTSDGGNDWKCKELQNDIKTALSYSHGIGYTDIDNGWILTDTRLYFTKDGGNIWKRKSIMFEGSDF